MKKTIFFTLLATSTLTYNCATKLEGDKNTEVYQINTANSACDIGSAYLPETIGGNQIYPRKLQINNKTEQRVYARVETSQCKSVGFLIPPKGAVNIARKHHCKPLKITGYPVDTQNKQIGNERVAELYIDSTHYESKRIKIKGNGSYGMQGNGSYRMHGLEIVFYYPLQINITNQGDGTLKFEQQIIK